MVCSVYTTQPKYQTNIALVLGPLLRRYGISEVRPTLLQEPQNEPAVSGDYTCNVNPHTV